ncbi:hypothetical protein ES703_16312 [subsurface metagenome]
MSAKRGIKRVVASIAMEAVLEGVRGYFEELLSSVTPEQLYEAIKKGVDPWDFAPSKIKRRGSTWVRQMRKYQDRLTPQLVLEWLQTDRPDLHSLIVNMGPKGTRWIVRMTEDVKLHLWPPEGGLKLIRETPEEEALPELEETPDKIRYI